MEMLDRETQEMKRQLAKVMDELNTTREKLACVSAQEAALVHQNAKMSMELVEGEKKQKKLQTELNGLRAQLASKESEVDGTKEELHSAMSKHKSDVATLQQDLEEKTKRLKEYQDKASELCELAQGHDYYRNMYPHNCLARTPLPHAQPGHVLTSMIDL